MKSEVQKIIDIVKHTYEKNAWHGPSVKEVLATVTESEAFKKTGDSNSIIELVAHMTAWRTYVIEKLKGNATFELSDEQNFPKEKNWKKALAALEASQTELVHQLEQTPDSLLNEKVPNRPFKFFTMLHGIIHHDLYHTGQILLIKKYS
jgi:uncharacterized damage-inducible protein DinB